MQQYPNKRRHDGSVKKENHHKFKKLPSKPGITVKTEMGEDGVEIKLWYSNGAKFKTECFFWCTRDGSVPSRKPQNLDVSELLLGEFRVSPIKMGTNDSQPLDISPMTVYFTNQGCVSCIMSFMA